MHEEMEFKIFQKKFPNLLKAKKKKKVQRPRSEVVQIRIGLATMAIIIF